MKSNALLLKKLLLTVVAVLVTLSIYGQGTVNFSNDGTSLIRTILNYQNGVAQPATGPDGIRVALYWAPLSDPDNFTVIGNSVSVGGPIPIAGQFIGGTRTTGAETLPGDDALFIVKAWELAYGATFEAARSASPMFGRTALRAESPVFRLTTGGNPPDAAANLQGTAMEPGFQGFTVVSLPNPREGPLPLVSEGAAWRYLADGSDQGTAWRSTSFNDASWPSGPSPFGFGDEGAATVIGNETNAIVTFYFRSSFFLYSGYNSGLRITNLFGQAQVDDGVILYLNGTEIYRRNMTNTEVTLNYRSLASAAIAGTEETTFWSFLTNANALVHFGTNVLAAEVHQVANNSSDLRWNLDFVGYAGRLSPVITITSPITIAPYNAAGIPLLVRARDPDGTVVEVRIHVSGQHESFSTTAPFSGVWPNPIPGRHIIYAVAEDNAGYSTHSGESDFVVGPPVLTVPFPRLVAEGAVWKYLADGSDQGTAWRSNSFNDASWPSGPARLGFGGEGEATVIGDRTNGIVTFYFRKNFTVEEDSSITDLFGQVQVDDGVILYLNGTEIYRRNIDDPDATLNYRSLASVAVDGADETTFWTFRRNNSALRVGKNVLAAEVHQQATNSSDLGWNLDLLGDYNGALPPIINIASPTNTLPYAARIPLLVNTRDPDGIVTNVDFYLDSRYAARAVNPPFTSVWAIVTLGDHTIFAVAKDNTGLFSFSSVASFTVMPPGVLITLVNSNSTWKYLDDGSDQGIAWRANAYNHTSWSNGVAELGYGDGDEVTTVRSNRLDGSRIVTTYFRKIFNVANPANYSTLVVRLRRDDGGVVYLNGEEIFRSNMTTGPGVPVFYTSLAAIAADEVSYFSTNATASLLRVGDNVVAVEIHQANITSTDISFDLQLQAQSGPVLFISRAHNVVTLDWQPATPGLQLQYAPTVTGPWAPAPTQANPQSFAAGLPAVFWRLFLP